MLNEYDSLRRVAVATPRHVFKSSVHIAKQWRALNFTSPPDLGLATEQHAVFVELIEKAGVEIIELILEDVTLDAIFVRDASIVTPQGLVLCRMGKSARQDEPRAQAVAFGERQLSIAGAIEAPGLLEGGDVVWFDERTVAVGRGKRTNDEGIRQLGRLLGPDVQIEVVPLPDHRDPCDVFHLMSMISPIDRDLAVVYSRLMPLPFREWLCSRGIRFVEVPDEEFASMGGNLLAVRPRRAVMLDGNPITRKRLEGAGVEVATYDGSEISVKGGGGPTCLTRPLVRGL